ncbi:MAG: signal peptidase I [Solibacillus sp.]
MTNFKRKLDDMMGDTSRQEARIKQHVTARLAERSKKRNWQMPAVAVSFVLLAIFFISSTMNNQLSADEGRGIPYDPLDDLAEIATLQQKGELSVLDEKQLLTLPVLNNLTPLQYVDAEPLQLAGEMYHTVIERKAGLFDEVVYAPGDVVRTMTNTSSHLPIYDKAYYEVVAIPGDRVVLQNGELKVNGKPVKSALLELYEANGNEIAGGYDQLLNAREYLLLNHFPAAGTLQAATITAVHKIYGEVVGLAKAGVTQSIYLDGVRVGYAPEHYFDLYLYDQIFGAGELARELSVNAGPFPNSNRISELFLEAAYRTVTPLSEDKVEIRYSYGRAGVGEYVFYMYKNSQDIWRWGN